MDPSVATRYVEQSQPGFFREAITVRGSASPLILRDVLAFGAVAVLTVAMSQHLETRFGTPLKLEVGWFELAGAAVSLLLVMRTNGGYDRWWEARKLWGGIVNQSRNLAISALSFGPDDREWRDRFLRLAACFPHVARASLRGEPTPPSVRLMLGTEGAEVDAWPLHRPSAIALLLGQELQRARHEHRLDGWAFVQIDRERASLIDHIGGCERILKTPLPRVYSIKIRRLIALFLMTLPLVLLHRVSVAELIPLITMAVAYPLLALDRVGHDLQDPFRVDGLAPLPLEDICAGIEKDVLSMLNAVEPDRALRKAS